MKRNCFVKWILILSLWVLQVVTPGIALSQEEVSPEGIYKESLPSIMTLTVEKRNGTVATGTAFLALQDGIAVTAWHLVADAKKVSARFATDEVFDVSGLVDKDEKRDIALVRVKVFGRPLLALSKIEAVIGQKAYIIGAPLGLDFSISNGLVSQNRTIDNVKYYQFTCAASPGNSGGPLINAQREVVGVVSWQMRDGQNLNFAIPSTYVLGLDATLPTQPWDTVIIQTPPSVVNKLSDDEIDKLLAEGFVIIYDGDIEIYFALEIAKISLNRKALVVPSGIYSSIDSINMIKSKLSIITTTGFREDIRIMLVSEYEKQLKAYSSLILAFTIAQKTMDWRGEPNNLASMIYSYANNQKPWTPDIMKSFHASNAFLDSCPVDLQYLLGIIEDKTNYRLGVFFLYKVPMWFRFVRKSGFAYSIGLRSGDTVISINEQKFSSFYDMKIFLKEHLGEKVQIIVMRDSKEKLLTPRLPKSLPKSALIVK